MESFLKKTGWTGIITSLIFAVIGIVLITNPETTVKIVSYVLGGIFIVMGIIKIISYFIAKGNNDFYNYDIIYGIIALILGIVTIIYSSTIGMMFRIMIAAWIIYSALIRIGFALKLKNANIKTWITVLILAVCMLGIGVYILLDSGIIVVTVGIVILVYALADLIESIIFMRKVNEIL